MFGGFTNFGTLGRPARGGGENVSLQSARKWIEDNSQERKNELKEIHTEKDLFDYLKDGKVLCRLVGHKTGNTIDGIQNGTYNVSSLEEENVKLFIQKCKDLLNIDNIFGDKEEKVFRDPNNVGIVLNAIAKLSENSKIGSITKLKQVAVDSRPRLENLETEEINEIYEYAENNEYISMMDDEASNPTPTSLEQSVEVMIEMNLNFLNNCLLNIHENFLLKNTNELLKNQFFPALNLNLMLDLHKSLARDLEHVRYCYADIGNVFEQYEDYFLNYCEIFANQASIMEFLKEKLSFNPDIKEHIEKLTKDSHKTKRNKGLYELQDLINMISQAIMRFPMALADVKKQARKSNEPKIEMEAQRAYQAMSNIMDHINNYKKDMNNIESVLELQHVLHTDQLQEKGILFYETKEEVEVYIKSSPQRVFNKFKLYIFEEVIVAFEIKNHDRPKKGPDGKIILDIWGNPIKIKEKKYSLKEIFKIQDISEMLTPVEEPILCLNTYNGVNLRADKSCEIKFNTEVARTAVYENLKTRQKEMSDFDFLIPGSSHRWENGQEHRWEKFQNPVCREDREEDHFKCAECHGYLGGKIITAIYCLDCQRHYHVNCFQVENIYQEREAPEDTHPEAEQNPGPMMPFARESSFNVGDKSNEEARQMLKNKRKGTFLVRYSSKHKKYFINSNNKESFVTKIEREEVQGYTLFFLPSRKGFSCTNLVDLINDPHTRDMLKLVYPINDEADILEIQETNIDGDLNMRPDTPETPEISLDGMRLDLAEEDYASDTQERYSAEREENFSLEELPFNHGRITRQEAEKRLYGKDKGTFLLRLSEEDHTRYKLSWNDRIRVKHINLVIEDGQYRIYKKSFPSFEELVDYYMSEPPTQTYYLLQGLNNPNQNICDDRRMNMINRSRSKKKPESLPYHHGLMTNKDAMRLLSKEPSGTFFLRTNAQGEHRISYKKDKKVEHIRILNNDNYYWLQLDETRKFPSVRRLVEEYVQEEKGVISRPLRSAFHDKNAKKPNPVPETNSTRRRRRVMGVLGALNKKRSTDNRSGIHRTPSQLLRTITLDEEDDGYKHLYELESGSEEEEDLDNRNSIVSGEYANPEEEAPMFHNMDSKAAKEFLRKRSRMTYLLRRRPDGQPRISYKDRNGQIEHRIIYGDDSGQFSTEQGGQMMELGELLQQLNLGTMIYPPAEQATW